MSLVDFAREWNVPIFDVIRHAHFLSLSDTPTPSQTEELRRRVIGYYNLTDADARTIEDMLNKDAARELLSKVAPLYNLLPDEQRQSLVRTLAGKLYPLIDDAGLQKKLNPQTLGETILNLGVISLQRSNATSSIGNIHDIPAELLEMNYDVSTLAFRRYMTEALEKIQITSPKDFDRAEIELLKAYQLLLSHVTHTNSGN